jgi:hypothetical protein
MGRDGAARWDFNLFPMDLLDIDGDHLFSHSDPPVLRVLHAPALRDRSIGGPATLKQEIYKLVHTTRQPTGFATAGRDGAIGPFGPEGARSSWVTEWQISAWTEVGRTPAFLLNVWVPPTSDQRPNWRMSAPLKSALAHPWSFAEIQPVTAPAAATARAWVPLNSSDCGIAVSRAFPLSEEPGLSL